MCQLIVRKVHAGIKNDSCMRYEVVVMQMVDFSQYEQNQRMYGGTALYVNISVRRFIDF